MTAAEGSVLGLALQTAKGTPNVTDASFNYMLFNQGTIAPTNVALPLDTEVGGGAMLRDVKKVGVMSGGAIEFVPRPKTLGYLLKGALGGVTTVAAGTGFKHTFELGTDQFAAPYFTVRSAPGMLWGEQFQDMRVSSLALSFKGSDFVRAQAAFAGGLPKKVATTTWDAPTYLDGGPQFIAPVSAIELPAATSVKVLSGSFNAGMAIPLDEQWVVGSYSPDDFDIVSRAFAISLVLKITDATLYSKMNYDPTGVGSDWVAKMFREGAFKLNLVSDIEASAGVPYSLAIKGNGLSGDDANVVWSANPIGIRAGKQIIMAVTGLFIASPTAAAPISIELTNKTASYAA